MWPLIPMSVPLRRPGHSSIHKTVILIAWSHIYIPGNPVMGHRTIPSNRHIFQTPLFTGGPYQQMVDLICRAQTPPTILEFGQSWGDPGSRGEPHFAWYAPTVFHQNFPIRSKTRLKKPPSKEYFLCTKISQSVRVSRDSRLVVFWEAFDMKERTRKTKILN